MSLFLIFKEIKEKSIPTPGNCVPVGKNALPEEILEVFLYTFKIEISIVKTVFLFLNISHVQNISAQD